MSNRQTKNRASTAPRTDRPRGDRRGARRLITAGVLAGLTSVPALAGPRGEQVVHGSAVFNRRGNNTTITTSQRAIINYESFNLNRAESVRFIQPNASASVLNRITNGMPTSMDGSIFANGNVYFVNPAGIYFGRNAVINVGGIYAAAGSITNEDFLSNVNRFTDLSGEVINRGQINAVSGAHLVGRRVANFGQIVAPDGMITMTAGKDVLIGERGGKVFARIKGEPANPGSVENHGVIDAGSGQVIAGVGDHFALALYDTSKIRASSIRVAGGAHSSVRVGGDLDASNPAGRGGEIDVLGGKIALRGADLDASGATAGGQIHVGGDFQGKGDRLRARATFVDASSTLSVDSANGDAGRAVVWSDGATFFYGDISARGAGEGGFAEVSSKGMLDFRGTFDLRGALRNGTLLLDPKNIQVVANGTGPAATEADFDEFADNASGSSLLDADLLSGWLNGPGAEVVLQASNDIFFLNGANVVQNAGNNVDLRLLAGRRIMFLNGSVLSLDGGSLFATANAQGFVAGQRDPGFGSIIVTDGAVIRSNAGALNFTVDSTVNATSTPGDLVLFGDVRAPVLSLTATYINSRVGLVEDGDAGNDTIGFGGRVSIDAGQFVAFLNQPGEWSFESLSIVSPLIVFDADATGVTATGAGVGDGLDIEQTVRLGAVGLFTQNTSGFTFTGQNISLDAELTADGGVTFAGPVDLFRDMAADGDIVFQQAVTLNGPIALTLVDSDASGDLVAFNSLLNAGVPTPDLTLNLNGGGAMFGQTGSVADPLGDIVVNDLGSTLSFSDEVFANSLTSLSGAGDIIFSDDVVLSGVSADGTNSLNLLASGSTIGIGGGIDSFASINFGSDVELNGGGLITITLLNGGSITFGGTLDANLLESLTLELNGGAASFVGAVGGAGALGAIDVNGLGGTLDFQSALTAASLDVGDNAGDDAGTVSLLGGATLTGGLNVFADTININNAAVNAGAIDLTWSTLFNGDADVLRAATVGLTADGVAFVADTEAEAVDETVVTDLTMRAINGAALTLSGTAAADAIDTITNVTLDSSGVLRFQGHAGGWSFVNLAATGVGIEFDGSTGLTVLGQVGADQILDATTGDITLTGIGAGEFVFDITPMLVLSDDISADGDLRFATAVELAGTGDRAIAFTTAGSTLTFDATLDSAATNGLVLDLNGGSAAFTGAVGATNRLGDIAVNDLGGALNFASTLTAGSLVSQSGTGSVTLAGTTDLDPTAADDPANERLVVSAADIAIGDTVTTDLIDLTYTNSLSLGVLNAETVRVTADGANLVFGLPGNIGLDVSNLRLETLNGGELTLVGTLPTIDLTGPAGGNVRDVAEARFISDNTLFFVGAGVGDGADWLFQDLLASANEGIVFSATTPQTISWADALDGIFALNADADNTGGVGDLIAIASGDFTFGGVGGAFALRDDIIANGGLTFDRDVVLHNGARRINLLNAGDTVAFNSTLTANAGNNLNLGLNTGGATFAGQVGDNAAGRLGDLVVENLGTTLGFQADLFADSITSTSGAGDIIFGGDLDLAGVNAGGVNSIELTAAPTTIEIHGDITSFADALFNTAAELHGDVLHTITMLNGSTLTFNGTLIDGDGGAVADSLTLELAGNASAIFNANVGDNAAGRLGDVRINNLGAMARFSGSLFASTLFVNNDGGPVAVLTLGDTVGGDVVDLDGAIGDNALDVDTSLTVVGSDISASAGGMLFNGHVGLAGGLATTDADGNIILNDGVDVRGDRTVSVVDGMIDIFRGAAPLSIPVLLNNTAADSALRLVSNNGLIRIESTPNGSVIRSAGAFGTTLEADSVGGFIDLGSVAADGNALTLLDLDTANGVNVFRGGRYFADTVMLNAGGGHTVSTAPSTVIFGDDNGVTSEVNTVSITGGNLVADPGQTVELNALAAGGTVTLDGARTNGAGTILNLNADNLAAFGAGDTLGSAGFRFAEINVNSTDVGVQSAVFADSLFFNPRTGTLNYGGGAGDMLIDAGEVATLNLGSVGTLFLGHNDPATAGAFAGTTNLFGVSSIGDFIRVFGTTSVDGVFDARDGQMHLYGPVTLMDNAGLSTSNAGQGMFFYDSLGVMANNTLTTNGGPLSFINLDPDGPGGPTGLAAINGAGGGTFDLTINTNGGRATLFNVGDATALTMFDVTANQVFFNGSTYNAAAQTYTSDEYRLLGDFSGALPGQANFNGDTLVFNDAGGLGNAEIRIANGIDLAVLLTDSFTSDAALLGNPIGGLANQSVVINAGNAITFTDSIGFDGTGDPAAADTSRFIGSLSLTSNTVTLANALTSGTQVYTAAGGITLNGDRYQSLAAAPIAFNGTVNLAPASGTTTVLTADGGTVTFGGTSVNGNDNTLMVNTGPTGVINYAAGIDINNAAQDYTAGAYNFAGAATLSNDQPVAGIAFNGGTLNMGGMLTLRTTGTTADIALGGLVNLGGFGLDAFADGTGSNVTFPALVSNGGETVRVRAGGTATLGGIQNVGVAVLDLRSNQLAINGATLADSVLVRAFSPATGISVGGNTAGTLNLDNAELALLAPVAGGANTLEIGEAGYAGTIFINNATVNRDTMFIADGAGGLIRLVGLNGTGGLTALGLSGGEVRLGGAIGSDAGAFTLDITGPVNVFNTAAVRSNGGAVAFNNAINGLTAGGGFLDIDTAGGTLTLPETLGVIGAARALDRARFVGAPTLRLVGVNTEGNQFFDAGQIVLLDGAAFTADNGAMITFAAPTSALGSFSARINGADAGNDIAFLGDLVGPGNAATAADIDAGANGSVELLATNGFGSLTLAGSTITLGGDLAAINDLAIQASRTFITADRMLSAGNSITLNTDLDSQAAPASLSLEDAITTLINGRLGAASPLASFTSSDRGTTTLTGGVLTNGRTTFRNDVLVSGDAVVQSLGDTAADGIRFLGSIDGAAPGTGSLTLITDRTRGRLLVTDPILGTLRPDADVPLIELFGSVGLTNALDTIAFNVGTDLNGNAVDGRDFVPANATIVLGDSDAFRADGTLTNFTLNADNMLMGAREKLLTLGSLKADGSFARLSDMATIGDMLVGYTNVTILLREQGFVFDPTTQTAILDQATDFVAGGDMQFATITALQPLGLLVADPEFSLPGGDPSVTSNAGFFLFKALSEPVENLVIDAGVLLDPRADGPSNTNVAEAIAGAAPRQEQAEPAVAEPTLNQAAIDALTRLQITLKDPNDPTYLIDLPADVAPAGVARVSRRRLEPSLVDRLVNTYRTSFFTSATDPTGAIVQIDRRGEIQNTLADAVDAFDTSLTGDTEITAEAFLAYLRDNADTYADAINEIERLRRIVGEARMLGLTEEEIVKVKSALVRDTKPENLASRVFTDLIDPGEPLLLGVR